MGGAKERDEEKVVLLPNKEANELRDAVARLMEAQEEAEQQVEKEPADIVRIHSHRVESPSLDNAEAGAVSQIPIDRIAPSPYQTREMDRQTDLEGLVQSIHAQGVIQPIIVRALADEESVHQYELIAGERRLRAAEAAGLGTIPAIVREIDELSAVQISVIENAQRADLNPVEEALAFKTLAQQFKMKQADIAQTIGKSRVAVSNSLRLLQLEPEVLELLKTGDLSAGHGKALLAVDDLKAQLRLAHRVVQQGLSVRALERIIQRLDDVEGVDEEADRDKRLLERQATRVADYLEMDHVNLSRDSQGRKRLQLTFETEAAWKRFVSYIRD